MGVTMFDFLSDKLGYHTKLYVILPGVCQSGEKAGRHFCICCMAVEETARTGSGFLPLSGMRRKKTLQLSCRKWMVDASTAI